MHPPSLSAVLTRNDQDWMNVSESLLIVSACVVGIPCGKPAYVFSVPFCHEVFLDLTPRPPASESTR